MHAINHVGYTLDALRKHAKRDGDKLCSITPHEAARLITHYDAIVNGRAPCGGPVGIGRSGGSRPAIGRSERAMSRYTIRRRRGTDGAEYGPTMIFDGDDAIAWAGVLSIELVRQANAAQGFADMLEDLLEYFEQRQDVKDGDYGVPEPNTEMSHATRIREALLNAGVKL